MKMEEFEKRKKEFKMMPSIKDPKPFNNNVVKDNTSPKTRKCIGFVVRLSGRRNMLHYYREVASLKNWTAAASNIKVDHQGLQVLIFFSCMLNIMQVIFVMVMVQWQRYWGGGGRSPPHLLRKRV